MYISDKQCNLLCLSYIELESGLKIWISNVTAKCWGLQKTVFGHHPKKMMQFKMFFYITT